MRVRAAAEPSFPGDAAMKKLKLNVEELTLDTFDADEAVKDDDGTVEAFANTQQFRCTYFCTYSSCTGLPC